MSIGFDLHSMSNALILLNERNITYVLTLGRNGNMIACNVTLNVGQNYKFIALLFICDPLVHLYYVYPPIK